LCGMLWHAWIGAFAAQPSLGVKPTERCVNIQG
jgi:hypothetical protein